MIEHEEVIYHTDPSISLRENFREIVIKSEFKKANYTKGLLLNKYRT